MPQEDTPHSGVSNDTSSTSKHPPEAQLPPNQTKRKQMFNKQQVTSSLANSVPTSVHTSGRSTPAHKPSQPFSPTNLHEQLTQLCSSLPIALAAPNVLTDVKWDSIPSAMASRLQLSTTDQAQGINYLIMDLDFISQQLKHTNKNFVLLPHTYLQHLQITIKHILSLQQDTQKQTHKLTQQLLHTKTKYANLASAKIMTTDSKIDGLDAKVTSLQIAKATSYVQTNDQQSYVSAISNADTAPSTSTHTTFPSRYSSSRGSASSSVDNGDLNDRRLIISLPKDARHSFTDKTSAEMVRIINAALQNTFQEDSPTAESVATLKSGDLAIYLTSQRSQSQIHSSPSAWVQEIDSAFKLQGPSRKYGVRITNCPKLPAATITHLLQLAYPEGQITHTQILSTSNSGLSTCSIVLYTRTISSQTKLRQRRSLALNGATLFISGSNTPPATQCFTCCSFQHMRKDCTNVLKCAKCSQPHTTASCTIVPKGSTTAIAHLCTCPNCGGPHPAWSYSCPRHPGHRPIKQASKRTRIASPERVEDEGEDMDAVIASTPTPHTVTVSTASIPNTTAPTSTTNTIAQTSNMDTQPTAPNSQDQNRSVVDPHMEVDDTSVRVANPSDQ
jgi:hypothetical protein